MSDFYTVKWLGALSKRWLKPKFIYRKKAVQKLVTRSHFSSEMAECVIDSIFKELSESNLKRLLQLEFGDARLLSTFQKNALSGNFHKVTAPRQITHIFSGNVPNPAIFSFVFGMLLGSRNVGKVSTRDEGFLEIYLESVKKYCPQLARNNFLVAPNNRVLLEREMDRSDVVVAYGSDETLESIRSKTRPGTKFVGYGHKMSFSIYLKEALNVKNIQSLVRKTVDDLWMVRQQGCLSPLILFVEKGGSVSPEVFSKMVFERLEKKGGASLSAAKKDYFKIQKIANEQSTLWSGQWLVLVDSNLKTFPSELGGGAVSVKAFEKKEDVLKLLAPFKRHLQAVALEAPTTQRLKIAEQLAELGFNRVTRAGKLQSPPLFWHHDGRPNFSDWVSWVDLE